MAATFRWLTRLFQSLSAEDKRLAEGVANITGRAPKNLDLFKLAVRHSSFNSGANGEHNERLEFLGDAVLGAVVAEYLFKKFPKRDEGFLTEIRSRLVNGESLGKLATKINLDQLIQYEGRRKMPHTHRSMNGDAMEALIGAFYLDTDFGTCRLFIIDRLLKPHYDIDEVVESDQNHKSRMIEWAQKNGHKLVFDIALESGRGSKDFVANVVIDGKQFATGSGFSKKKAEQAAAQNAIAKIKEKTEQRNRGPETDRLRSPESDRQRSPDTDRHRSPDTDRQRSPDTDRQRRPEGSRRPDTRVRENPERTQNLAPTDGDGGEATREYTQGRRPERRVPRSTRINQEDLYNEAGQNNPTGFGGLDENPAAPNLDRADRPERTYRTDRPEPTPRPDRTERPERTERSDRYERAERPERTERPERVQRPERAERPERPEPTERTESTEQFAPYEPAPSPERTEQPLRIGRPIENGMHSRRERPPRRDRDSNPIAADSSQSADALPDPSSWSLTTPSGVTAQNTAALPESNRSEQVVNRPATPLPNQTAPLQANQNVPEPKQPAVDFQVNSQRIQPKAVEINQAAPVAPIVSAPKRKWVNVSVSETGAQTPKQDVAQQARQAFDSIANEADSFFKPKPDEKTDGNKNPETDSDTGKNKVNPTSDDPRATEA